MDLDRIRVLSDAATKENEAMKDAIGTERSAKVLFLKSLVLVVKDALPAVCSRVPAYAAGKASEYGKRVDRWLEGPYERAVLIGGSDRPDPPKARIEGVEPLKGAGLYISESGRFFAVSHDGRFRNSEHFDEYWWEAQPRSLTPEEVIAERWPVDRVAEALAAELEVQVAGKHKASEKARRTAERVREAARILEGVR